MAKPRLEVLEYAPTTGPESRTKWHGLIALVISLPSAAIVFLDFAESTSPWNVVSAFFADVLRYWYSGDWELAFCGMPFFLAFPLMWLGIRSIFGAKLSAPENVGVWSLIGLSACATLIIYANLVFDFLRYHDSGGLTAVATGSVIGAAAIVWWRRHLSPERYRLISLYVCYMFNGVICLFAFADNRNLGWYAALIVICGMCGEVIRFLIPRTPRGFAPP